MLVNINNEYFVDPKSVTHARVIRNDTIAILMIYLVNREKIVLTLNSDLPNQEIERILEKIKC